jgi:SP family myo-inositol transporter-like MFS transporter 13
MYRFQVSFNSKSGADLSAFFIPFGQVVSSAVGAGMQNVRHGWRILFALGVIPSVLQLILMHWLPESPRVMILRGQEDLARETYKRIYSKATPEVIELKLRVAKLYVEATTQMQRGMTFWGRCKRLWTHKPYRRAIITVSGLQMFGQLTGFNTLLYYSGTLFGLFGFSNGAAAGLIPAGINALFVVSRQFLITHSRH